MFVMLLMWTQNIPSLSKGFTKKLVAAAITEWFKYLEGRFLKLGWVTLQCIYFTHFYILFVVPCQLFFCIQILSSWMNCGKSPLKSLEFQTSLKLKETISKSLVVKEQGKKVSVCFFSVNHLVWLIDALDDLTFVGIRFDRISKFSVASLNSNESMMIRMNFPMSQDAEPELPLDWDWFRTWFWKKAVHFYSNKKSKKNPLLSVMSARKHPFMGPPCCLLFVGGPLLRLLAHMEVGTTAKNEVVDIGRHRCECSQHVVFFATQHPIIFIHEHPVNPKECVCIYIYDIYIYYFAYVCVYTYIHSDDYDLNDDTWIFGNWYCRYINSIFKRNPPQIPWQFFTAGNLSQVFHPSGLPAESSLEALLESKVLREALLLRLHGQLQVNQKNELTRWPWNEQQVKAKPLNLGKHWPQVGEIHRIPKKSIHFFGGAIFDSFREGRFFWDLELWILFTIVMMFILHVHEMHIIGYSAWGPICETHKFSS